MLASVIGKYIVNIVNNSVTKQAKFYDLKNQSALPTTIQLIIVGVTRKKDIFIDMTHHSSIYFYDRFDLYLTLLVSCVISAIVHTIRQRSFVATNNPS